MTYAVQIAGNKHFYTESPSYQAKQPRKSRHGDLHHTGVISEIIQSYNALGLEVILAGMNVHTLNNTLETKIYGDVIRRALAAGITDISFWGLTDKHAYTWVPGAQPLILNANYTAKSELYAVHGALAGFADAQTPQYGHERL